MATILNQGFLVQGTVLGESDNDTFSLENEIRSIMILKNFNTDVFPLFIIDFKTTQEHRDIIRDNKVKIQLKIFSYNIEGASVESEDTTDPTIDDIIFDGVIRLYDKPLTYTTSKKEEEEETNNSQVNSALGIYYRVFGIPENLIEKNKFTVNKIFKNVSINDILVNLISDVESDDIFIQSSDNTETYSQIIIPPLTIPNAISLLDEQYKIYNGIAGLFFDFNRTYLVNKVNHNFEPENTFEYFQLSSDSTANSADSLRPTIDKATNNIQMKSRNLPGLTSADETMDHYLGSNRVSYSYDDNFDLVIRADSLSNSYEKNKYFWNKQKNKLHEDSEKTMILNEKISLGLTLTGVSLNYFKPTTRFILESEETAANGEYFLNKEVFSLKSSDGKHFQSVLSLELNKKVIA